ncbi:hypothetical protein BDR07DRAFT_1490207 [Suillus spraguei]|nr:hypothetical protein BDR07DRAFT_1490207 [Suillus spraguei]
MQLKDDKETGQRTVVWSRDESTFYANDQCKKCWVHKDEKATPQPKGEGSSLMVTDFVLTDYGWLRSHDRCQSAHVLFRAGKGRDGYFTNDENFQHAKKAMTILEKDYPEDDHIFVFDNAMTHLKRADDALSAQSMPKTCKNWRVNAPVRDATGKQTCGEFYFPKGHTNAGLFKGMAKILEEHDFDVGKKRLSARISTVRVVPLLVVVAEFSITNQISLMLS